MSGKESIFIRQRVPLYNTAYQWLKRFANRKMNAPPENDGSSKAVDITPKQLQLFDKKSIAFDQAAHSGVRFALEAELY
jgi:hypothetical protein